MVPQAAAPALINTNTDAGIHQHECAYVSVVEEFSGRRKPDWIKDIISLHIVHALHILHILHLTCLLILCCIWIHAIRPAVNMHKFSTSHNLKLRFEAEGMGEQERDAPSEGKRREVAANRS